MALNGIDISNYQRGLDLAQVPCDFVICKATEGTTIVHNTCDPWVQQAIKLGKLWGFYHFMNGEDPIAQAKHFVASCRNYFGNGIPVLDYEMYGRIGTDKAKQFLDYVYDQTGVRCIVYMSRSVCTEEDWSKIAPNHALWVAQYANNNRTGYQSSPWLPDGGFGAWGSCAIHQYTSNGRLDGFNAPLDLDIAYMTREAWGKFANTSGSAAPDVPPAEVAEPSPDGTTLDLAAAVMRGEYGVDDERREKLGDRYQEVQDLINYIDGASASQLADDVERGMFGVVPTRSDVLGDRFSEVQAIVNQRLALALRASTPSRAATRSARLALRSVSTGTPSQARTASGHLIRSTPARSFLISVQSGYPDKGCPAFWR